MTYSILGADDSNLQIVVTDSGTDVVLNIQPAAVNIISAVTSVNGQTGAVVIDAATPASVTAGDASTLTSANAYTDAEIASIDYPVDSVNGATGSVVLTTSNISEGTGLYYTDARADARVAAGIAAIDYPVDSVNGATGAVTLTTSNIAEGTNQYFTTARAISATASAVSTGDANTLTSANSYTDSAIANLVDTAPATLNTLNELAAALGDDPNFATTVTNSLASKASISSVTAGDAATLVSANAYTDVEVAVASAQTLVSANAYTDSQISGVAIPASTDDLPEGSSNLYLTDVRVQTVIDQNTAGFITGYTVTESDVTQHQTALSITESQISDLTHYTDSDAVAALEANVNTTLTDNLTVTGDFVSLAQVYLNNFEFPVVDYGRTDQWAGSAQTIDISNAYVKFQLRGNNTPTITFDTSQFFDNAANLRTVHMLIDYHSGPGNIVWPADLTWQSGSAPNFAGGIARDRYLLKLMGSGDRGWSAHLEQVFNPNTVSPTTNLKFNKLTDLNITDGSAGQVLSTNGAGVFTFVDQSGGGAASALGQTAYLGNLQVSDTNDITETLWSYTIQADPASLISGTNASVTHTGNSRSFRVTTTGTYLIESTHWGYTSLAEMNVNLISGTMSSQTGVIASDISVDGNVSYGGSTRKGWVIYPTLVTLTAGVDYILKNNSTTYSVTQYATPGVKITRIS